MPTCKCFTYCSFFNVLIESGAATALTRLQEEVCLKDNARCARHVVMRELGKNSVPENLLPSQHDRARQIISEAAGASPQQSR